MCFPIRKTDLLLSALNLSYSYWLVRKRKVSLCRSTHRVLPPFAGCFEHWKSVLCHTRQRIERWPCDLRPFACASKRRQPHRKALFLYRQFSIGIGCARPVAF